MSQAGTEVSTPGSVSQFKPASRTTPSDFDCGDADPSPSGSDPAAAEVTASQGDASKLEATDLPSPDDGTSETAAGNVSPACEEPKSEAKADVAFSVATHPKEDTPGTSASESQREDVAKVAPALAPRRRVAILGGAFDPITVAHIMIGGQVLHSGIVDEFWFCPCGPRPDKPGLKTSALDRYTMCQLAVNTMCSDSFPVNVTDHEVREKMFTYDSLCYLRDRYPDCDFAWVIGSDWLQPTTNIRSWQSKSGPTGDRLVNEFDFVVYKRPGYEVEDLKAYGPRMKYVETRDGFGTVESSISSSEVRARLKFAWGQAKDTGRRQVNTFSFDGCMVPPAVLSYIKRKGLYKDY